MTHHQHRVNVGHLLTRQLERGDYDDALYLAAALVTDLKTGKPVDVLDVTGHQAPPSRRGELGSERVPPVTCAPAFCTKRGWGPGYRGCRKYVSNVRTIHTIRESSELN